MVLNVTLFLTRHKTYHNSLVTGSLQSSLLDTCEASNVSPMLNDSSSPFLSTCPRKLGPIISHFSSLALNLFAIYLRSLSSVLIPTAMNSVYPPLCSPSHPARKPRPLYKRSAFINTLKSFQNKNKVTDDFTRPCISQPLPTSPPTYPTVLTMLLPHCLCSAL